MGEGRLDLAQSKRIRQVIIDSLPDQLKLPFYLWTRAAVVGLIERGYGIALSLTSVEPDPRYPQGPWGQRKEAQIHRDSAPPRLPVHRPVDKGLTLETPECRPARLVGRDIELKTLREHLGKSLIGQRQFVFLTGEVGIGKTTVLDEFQRQSALAVPDIRIASEQCFESFGGKEPFHSHAGYSGSTPPRPRSK